MNTARVDDSSAGHCSSAICERLDTTRASPLHRCAPYNGKVWRRGVVVYLVTVGLTYGLMLLTVLLSDVPAAVASSGVNLPFFQDWNIAFTFLVSVPIVLFLLMSDQSVLIRALGIGNPNASFCQGKGASARALVALGK